MNTHRTSAFSLVELSIVLVIVGLLVGVIIGGQSLIQASKLRSVSADLTRYKTAIFAFRDQYNAWPGDMPNATQYWGSVGGSGSDNTCYSTASTSAATCNGNGNGQIELSGVGGLAEPHRAWQHLMNAGFIEGKYTGLDNALTYGVTIPGSKIPNAGFDVAASFYGGNWGELFSNSIDGNMLFFGSNQGIPRGVAIKPDEAWSIDTKIDDGKPDTGMLQTDTSFSAACFTGSYPNAAYALTTKSIACSFRYALKN